MTTITVPRALIEQALAFVRWECFGECRTPGWDGPPPQAHEVHAALTAALAAAPTPQAGEPVAMWTKRAPDGEWTPLYAHPAPTQQEADAVRVLRAIVKSDDAGHVDLPTHLLVDAREVIAAIDAAISSSGEANGME